MRKRIGAALLCCTMAYAAPVMAAETVDLSSMTLEELQELRESLDAEILAKGGGEVIGAGLYEAGVDIIPGTFTFTAGDDSANIIVYETKEEEENDGNYVIWEFAEEGEKVSVSLKGGNTLYLSNGLYIKVENTTPSWMPTASADNTTEAETGVASETETEVATE